MKKFNIIFLMSLIFMFGTAFAMPAMMTEQIVLRNASLEILSNYDANITMKIYNAYTGGSLLWEENKTQTTDGNGTIFLTVGNVNPIGLDFDSNYYIEVAVFGETLSPRFNQTTMPYAFRANVSDNLASSAEVPSSQITGVWTGGVTLPVANITGAWTNGVTIPVSNITGVWSGGGLLPASNITGETFPDYYNFTGDVAFHGNVTVNGDLLPNATLTSDIGSGAQRWNWLYVRNISAEEIETYNITAGNICYANGTNCLNITGVGVTIPSSNVTGTWTGGITVPY